MEHRAHPDFEAPPVTEVAIGLRFEPIPDLTMAHLGLFWANLRKDFTRSQEAAPLGPIQNILREGGGPLPRLWLIRDDEKSLIQLQPNIFYYNWRRVDDSDEYPRYDSLKPIFDDLFDQYTYFLTEHNLPAPDKFGCELTYINIIPLDTGFARGNPFKSIFPDFSWRPRAKRFLPLPKAVHWHSEFDMPESSGNIVVKMQSVKRVTDDVLALRFEIKADASQANFDLKATRGWFDIAHHAIVSTFVDLTSDRAQNQLWKRKDG